MDKVMNIYYLYFDWYEENDKKVLVSSDSEEEFIKKVRNIIITQRMQFEEELYIYDLFQEIIIQLQEDNYFELNGNNVLNQNIFLENLKVKYEINHKSIDILKREINKFDVSHIPS